MTGAKINQEHTTRVDRGLKAHVGAASIVLVVAIWLGSGTLAPHAATLDEPRVLEPCHYLVNIDHDQSVAAFAFLDGQPAETWRTSVALRRLLYPLLSYPAMKAGSLRSDLFGFIVGGVLTTAVIHIVALVLFVLFVRGRWGVAAAKWAAWLVATYPGVSYWAGLAHSYAVIVPLSLVCLILLFRIDETLELRPVLKLSLLLGLAFTGYDLLPLFGTAAALLVLRKRSWTISAANAAGMLAPSVIVGLVLSLSHYLPTSSNTSLYLNVVRSYSGPYAGWLSLAAGVPKVAIATFLFSNFVWLPLAWLLTLIFRRQGEVSVQRAELALAGSIAAVFLFNNLAPPYAGWQMRGDWIARLYQPLFVVMIAGVSRWGAAGRLKAGAVSAVILLNAAVIIGPLFSSPMSEMLYRRFYRHGSEGAMVRNLDRFGARPLGFCRTEHSGDPGPPGPPAPLPSYMYVPYSAPQ